MKFYYVTGAVYLHIERVMVWLHYPQVRGSVIRVRVHEREAGGEGEGKNSAFSVSPKAGHSNVAPVKHLLGPTLRAHSLYLKWRLQMLRLSHLSLEWIRPHLRGEA